MSHVVTLVTHTTNLTLDHLARVAAVLPGARDPVWLDEGTAADVPFAPPAGSDNRSWTGVARNALGDDPIDVVAQPARDRRKRLLIADMDSTMIAGECIDDLAAAAGVFDAVAAITMRSVRGLAPFEASLIERVRLLKGLSVADVSRVVGRVTPTAGAAVLVRTMQAHGASTILASGGFTVFTRHVARMLGFERDYANTLAIENGRLSGELRDPILGRASKRAILQQVRDENALRPEDTMAVGDGANDISMLEEAGLGVAFRAQPSVATMADARIDHSDLRALLFVQGYLPTEFVG